MVPSDGILSVNEPVDVGGISSGIDCEVVGSVRQPSRNSIVQQPFQRWSSLHCFGFCCPLVQCSHSPLFSVRMLTFKDVTPVFKVCFTQGAPVSDRIVPMNMFARWKNAINELSVMGLPLDLLSKACSMCFPVYKLRCSV